jgi:hypothetical protein
MIGIAPPQAAEEAGIRKKNGELIADTNAWKLDREARVAARKSFLASHETAITREVRGAVRNRLVAAMTFNVLRDYAIIAQVVVPDTVGPDGKPVTVPRVVGIDWERLRVSEHSACVAGLKFDRDTGMLVEYDQDAGLDAANQLRDMYGLRAARRTELTGKDGSPIEAAQTTRFEISDKPLTATEWAAQYGPATTEGGNST